MSRGIDVSKHQGNINWPTVAKNVDFALLRLGYRGYGAAGTLQLDECFLANIQGAVAAKIPIGIYFFSQAINAAEGREEAEFCIKHLKGHKLLYPVYFDAEYSSEKNHKGRADNISKEARTAAAKAFCETMEKAGYYAGVYTYTFFARDNKIDYSALATDYAMWLADYREDYDSVLPRGMHQYTGSGSCPGIVGDVDWNNCFVDYPTAIKNAGLSGWAVQDSYKEKYEKLINDIKALISKYE